MNDCWGTDPYRRTGIGNHENAITSAPLTGLKRATPLNAEERANYIDGQRVAGSPHVEALGFSVGQAGHIQNAERRHQLRHFRSPLIARKNHDDTAVFGKRLGGVEPIAAH